MSSRRAARYFSIPWQHWFMLMDAETGQLDPELRKALRLKPGE